MKDLFANQRVIIFSILYIYFFTPIPLYAQQDIEKATRETDRLLQKQREIEEKLRPAPKEIPKEEIKKAPLKEEEKFFVKKINLLGSESFAPEEFSPLIEKYENKETMLSELENLAKEIQQEYLRRGVIAAVFIPPQEIKEGIVTLQVVEARMGELEIQEHKYFKKEMLRRYWKIAKGEILRYDKLSHSIQLMNKNSDREVKSTLHAGKEPGTTDVILTAKTRFPMHATTTFDNEGSSSTGTHRWGVGTRHNNFLGFDDTLMAGYSFGRSFSGAYAYHAIPIGSNGASLLYGYSRSSSTPTEEYASSGVESDAKTTSISLHQDLYKKGEYTGEISIGFDAKDKTTKQNSGTTNRDRLRIIKLAGSFTQRGTGSITYFSPEFSQGINYFGASQKGNPLASRGANSTFSKFILKIQHKKTLPLNLQASLKLTGQISSTKLTPQEEFYVGGIDSVRGFPSGDFLADDALLTNLELLIPAFFIPKTLKVSKYAARPLRDEVTSLIFFDYGYGRRRGALPSEKQKANLKGAGPGLRIRLFDQALLRLEWGFPITSKTITEKGNSRFHFSVDFEDKLPEEIERIQKLIEEENIKQWAWDLLNEEISKPGSPLRKKFYQDLYTAKVLYKRGGLSQAKENYADIFNLGKSLYEQSQDYVRSCVNQQKELQEYKKLALKYYNEGEFQKAKEAWQKIIDGAGIKELALIQDTAVEKEELEITKETVEKKIPFYSQSLKQLIKDAEKNIKHAEEESKKRKESKVNEDEKIAKQYFKIKIRRPTSLLQPNPR